MIAYFDIVLHEIDKKCITKYKSSQNQNSNLAQSRNNKWI